MVSHIIYIYIACVFLCPFVSNKRQNGWTDRAQILCGSSRHPREDLWMSKRGMSTFPYKGWGGGFWPCFQRFLSDFLPAGLNCDLVFKQKPKLGKNNFPLHFSRIFWHLKKNFVRSMYKNEKDKKQIQLNCN